MDKRQAQIEAVTKALSGLAVYLVDECQIGTKDRFEVRLNGKELKIEATSYKKESVAGQPAEGVRK